MSLPHAYTHTPHTSGLGLEEEVPDYDLDSEDDEWLNAQTNERVSADCVWVHLIQTVFT